MALLFAALAGVIAVLALPLALRSSQPASCTQEPHEGPTALMQLQAKIQKGSSPKISRRWMPADDYLMPIGRTFLSVNPAASAQFLIDYYHAEWVELQACEGAERAAVKMPPLFLADTDPPPLIVFIKDATLPVAGLDVEGIIGRMNETLTRASTGAEVYWFFLDSHEGWRNDFITQKAVESELADGLPVVGFVHDSVDRGFDDAEVDALVQIPYTMQTIQMRAFTPLMPIVNQDDCRAPAERLLGRDGSWWKSTFVAANPEVAAKTVVNVLGALRLESPYSADAPLECTSATWVQLPGSGLQLHFVKASGDQHFAGEFQTFTEQVRSLRNITGGVLDLLMYNSLVLRVRSLDPWIARVEELGLPLMVALAGPEERVLFLDIPENDIIIQLRSDDVRAGESRLPELCTEQLVDLRWR